MARQIIIFTDGAAKGNPGPGGWGTIVCDGETVTELGGGAAHTTNNRMEMEGAIRGLELAQSSVLPVTIYTDSKYLIQGITSWIHGWRRRGWKTAQGSDVLNRELWERIDRLAKGVGQKVHWLYVPGHSGIPGNERVDEIASEHALGNHVDLYRGPLIGYGVDLTPPAAAPSAKSAGNGGRRTNDRKRSARAFSYLSLVGGVARRHGTWAECEKRVRGVSGAKFKKATSAADEAAILASWGADLD